MGKASSVLFSLNIYFIFILLVATRVFVSNGYNETQGYYKCFLVFFLDFTYDGAMARGLFRDDQNPGFAHLVAAQLAMEHFNARDSSVVPELAKRTAECPIQFDSDSSLFFDTGTVGHAASERFLKNVIMGSNGFDSFGFPRLPCAMAGPFQDMPALDLSTMAAAASIPLVVSRAFNMRVFSERFGPFTNQIYPDSLSMARKVVAYMSRDKKVEDLARTDFFSILYPRTDYGITTKEMLQLALDEKGMNWYSSNYMLEGSAYIESDRMSESLGRLKRRGYRTILVAMENPQDELPQIALAAEEWGMNTGDFLWVWFGPFHFEHLTSNDELVKKLIQGSSYLTAIDPAYITNASDPLSLALMSQDQDFKDRLFQINQTAFDYNRWDLPPVMQPPPSMEEPDVNFKQPETSDDTIYFEFGQSFIYDSVMSIGIAACNAFYEMNNNSYKIDFDRSYYEQNNLTLADFPVPGDKLDDAIRSVQFQGASGNVKFETEGEFAGSRLIDSSILINLNFLPFATGEDEVTRVTAFSVPFSADWLPFAAASVGVWVPVEPFIFADGTSNPPPLRDTPDNNFLNEKLRILGWVLFGIIVISAILISCWVYWNRASSVLTAAQPMFLYALILGSVIMASAILPFSFDESMGFSELQLSKSCKSTAMLLSIGYCVIYGALFAKLYRVNKVLQFRRRKVRLQQAVWPSGVMLFAALIVLAIWTAVYPLYWDRDVINDDTGASIGRCNSDAMAPFAAVLGIILVIPMILTGLMAWKTKDIDDAYTESKWIFILIVLQLEVAILGAPLVYILRNLSTNGRFIGWIVMILIFSMSTMILIMLPKFLAFRRALRGKVERQAKRGERVGTRISGNNQLQPKDPSDESRTAAESCSRNDTIQSYSKNDTTQSYSKNEESISKNDAPLYMEEEKGDGAGINFVAATESSPIVPGRHKE